MKMRYRIISRWGDTKEVKEQYFSDPSDCHTVKEYLNLAIENSCKVSFVQQERDDDSVRGFFDWDGWGNLGEWANLPWPREDA